MKKYLLFVIYILAVLLCSIFLILLVDTKSEAWQPKIIERATKKVLTKEGKKFLWQSQILMAVAFTTVEIMHGAL